MRTETQDIIAALSRSPLFQNVGKRIIGDVKQAASWAEAVRYCKSIEWHSVQLQVNNLLAMSVSLADYSRLEAWRHHILASIHDALVPIVDRHVLPLMELHRLPKAFRDSVEWDLGEICLETEFGDICQPIFFREQVLPWYEAGHFPCGWDGPKLDETWEGPMPEGQLIVF